MEILSSHQLCSVVSKQHCFPCSILLYDNKIDRLRFAKNGRKIPLPESSWLASSFMHSKYLIHGGLIHVPLYKCNLYRLNLNKLKQPRSFFHHASQQQIQRAPLLTTCHFFCRYRKKICFICLEKGRISQLQLEYSSKMSSFLSL